MATGVFNTARIGHNLRSRKRGRVQHPIDRFAELIATHYDDRDVAQGLADRPDRGGNVAEVARRMGIPYQTAVAMMRRIRLALGEQAQ